MTPFHPPHLITSAAQVRAWDAATVEAEGITSYELMQRAAAAFVRAFRADFPVEDYPNVVVVCGPGNNGGDGACAASLLDRRGYHVQTYGYWADRERRSADLQLAWRHLEHVALDCTHENDQLPPEVIAGADVVIDALFGVGLSRPAEGVYAELVTRLSAARALASVDVPSGQAIDGAHPAWPAVRATRTYTFGALKYAALLSDTGPAWGAVRVLDIGLAPAEDVGIADDPRVATADTLGPFLRPRRRFTHKGSHGHVLVLAGSRGHGGAALLSATGAYRAGAGLVTAYVPAALEQTLQSGLPEAMTLVDPEADFLTAVPDLGRYDAFVVGPGLGTREATGAFLRELLAAVGERPIVIDADALNLLATGPAGLAAKLPHNAVLTPHPGEFARLIGRRTEGAERVAALRQYGEEELRGGAVVVLKDQCTAVADATGRLSFNYYAGNPGMGTGGTGDVLSGVIAAQLAAGRAPWDAARVGVYLHARAGDLAAAVVGERALLAGDVAAYLGRVSPPMASRR